MLAERKLWPDFQVLSQLNLIWRWLLLVQVNPGATSVFTNDATSVVGASDHASVTNQEQNPEIFARQFYTRLLPNFY